MVIMEATVVVMVVVMVDMATRHITQPAIMDVVIV
jgi:hypothetical protein